MEKTLHFYFEKNQQKQAWNFRLKKKKKKDKLYFYLETIWKIKF